MPNLNINYTITGIPVGDMHCETFIEEFLNDDRITSIDVCTENMINAARAYMITRNIPWGDITLSFEGKELIIGKDLGLSEWPAGFCDYNENWLNTILLWRIT